MLCSNTKCIHNTTDLDKRVCEINKRNCDMLTVNKILPQTEKLHIPAWLKIK